MLRRLEWQRPNSFRIRQLFVLRRVIVRRTFDFEDCFRFEVHFFFDFPWTLYNFFPIFSLDVHFQFLIYFHFNFYFHIVNDEKAPIQAIVKMFFSSLNGIRVRIRSKRPTAHLNRGLILQIK